MLDLVHIREKGKNRSKGAGTDRARRGGCSNNSEKRRETVEDTLQAKVVQN